MKGGLQHQVEGVLMLAAQANVSAGLTNLIRKLMRAGATWKASSLG
jgi:hypothetical protein